MNAHHTKIELCGEEYAAVVLFESDESPWISSVTLCRSVKEFYNANGEFKPRVKLVSLDITPLLNSTQFSALTDEIMAEEKAEEGMREAA